MFGKLLRMSRIRFRMFGRRFRLFERVSRMFGRRLRVPWWGENGFSGRRLCS